MKKNKGEIQRPEIPDLGQAQKMRRGLSTMM